MTLLQQKKALGVIMPPQPINLFFEFLPTQKRIRVTNGKVRLRIGIGCELFGPYPTDIKTNNRIWVNRLDVYSPQGTRLRKQLTALINRLLAAWSELLEQERRDKRVFVTGDLVMNQAGLPTGREAGTHA